MDFEYDDNKSKRNKVKHGIDFVEAQILWDDPDLIEIPVITSDEPRFLIIGRIILSGLPVFLVRDTFLGRLCSSGILLYSVYR